MPEDTPTIIRPVSKPIIVDGAYSDDQHDRIVRLVRDKGPWQMILAQHFASAEEVVATMSGSMPEGVTPTFDMFLTPNFRGYLAKYGTCLHPEIEDCFLNQKFLDMVRGYWKADYASPDNMLFNINGPCHSHDPAHIDATAFRGINQRNTPIYLLNTMSKSGLFTKWQAKKAQIVTWFYKGTIGGGFTYWPNGQFAEPARIAAPMWNRGVVVENERMFHRAEANGPLDQRMPEGLAFESLFSSDPDAADGWQITTGEKVIQKVPAQEMRLMVHWGAEIFMDYAELKMVMEHTDDLTHDQVFDMFIKDLRARGHSFEVPTDPMRDQSFIKLLTKVYDTGAPRIYPAEAPGPHQPQLAA
ncbi:MAG TPA: hypothetical protein VIG90_12355 [Pedomonas sp.]|uniref:hypothetical protein n=1 Tax=Pedomonas sp. TaxID=2976421 RepID=UPI002F3EACD2